MLFGRCARVRLAAADKRPETFAFRNIGDDPVTIMRVTSSCGCTTPRLDKRTYAPSESGAITARFEIGQRSITRWRMRESTRW